MSFFFSLITVAECNAEPLRSDINLPGYDTLNDTELIQLFSYMYKEEVSTRRNPIARKYVIINNFKTIVSITRKQGFPKLMVQPKNYKKSTIINRCCSLTFHHILLDEPEYMLNDEVIVLFKKELEALRLPLLLLQNVMSIVQEQNAKDNFFSREIKNKFDLAIREWGISLNETSNE
ncbi:MAG: hypothetical protein IPM74_02240 [Crocinitomicaceae bacterium]|nr:hypothetical protein [Crocinitomicaceae bacterium]MBK8924736.1 hypothetical protein [Crocinitomicaceae bacterium]